MPDSEQPSGGLFRSARKLLSSGINAIQCRVELVKAELEKEKKHWVSILTRAVAVAVLGVSGLNILTVGLAYCFDKHTGVILLVAGGVYLILGMVLFLSLKQKMKSHKSFGNIKEVLKRDREAIDPDS